VGLVAVAVAVTVGRVDGAVVVARGVGGGTAVGAAPVPVHPPTTTSQAIANTASALTRASLSPSEREPPLSSSGAARRRSVGDLDHDLAAGPLVRRVGDRVGDLVEPVRALDDRAQLASLDPATQRVEVVVARLGHEEQPALA
jgi:hypothetical protein